MLGAMEGITQGSSENWQGELENFFGRDMSHNIFLASNKQKSMMSNATSRSTRLLINLLIIHTTLTRAAAPTTPGHRLLYVASAPFHGNKLLSELFSTCDKVSSSFQSEPNMGGDVVLSAAKIGLTKTYAARKERYYSTTQAVINALPHGWSYADTNPMFAHTYHDVVLRDFAAHHPVTVLLLRDHPARTLSRLEMNSDDVSFFKRPASTVTNHTLYTLYTQHSRLATTRPLHRWKNSSEKELLMGYLIDIESRRRQIRLVAARRRRVDTVDVWYDELIHLNSVLYLLESRLGLTKCNETAITQILMRRAPKETIQPSMLKNNAKLIQEYTMMSRNEVAMSTMLPSLALPTGTQTTQPKNCVLDGSELIGDVCSNQVNLLLHVGKANQMLGSVYFLNPVQFSAGKHPLLYFGVNDALPMPALIDDLRVAVITTEILEAKTLEIIHSQLHSTEDSTHIVEKARAQRLRQPNVHSTGLQFRNECASVKSKKDILCHLLPSSLVEEAYYVRMTVASGGESWSTMGWFSFT